MDLDPKSESMLSELYPDFSARVKRVYEAMFAAHQVALRMTEGLRTLERQSELYEEGRTTPGPNASPEHPLGQTVTNAPPGYSEHQYGSQPTRAFQVVIPTSRSSGVTIPHALNFFGRSTEGFAASRA